MIYVYLYELWLTSFHNLKHNFSLCQVFIAVVTLLVKFLFCFMCGGVTSVGRRKILTEILTPLDNQTVI